MKKFKKFTATASAAALLGAGAMTAPAAFAQEEGSAEGVTESSENSDTSDSSESSDSTDSAESSESSSGEGEEGEASSELQGSSDELSSTEEGAEGESDLSSNFPGSSTADGEEGTEEGSSEERQALLGVGIFAAIAGGIASFLPQIKDQLPSQVQQLIP